MRKVYHTLQLNDPTEYSGVLGNTRGVFPAAAKGRGIARIDGEIYEFQTAYCAKPGEEFDEIHGLCAALAENWDGPRAPKVPVLPEKCDAAFLADVPVKLDHFPIGVNKQTLEIESMDFTRQFAAFFTANDSDLLLPVMQGIAALWPEALWLKGEADLADMPQEAGKPTLVILPSLSELYDSLGLEAKQRFEEFFKNGKAGRGVSLLVFDDASGLQLYDAIGLMGSAWQGADNQKYVERINALPDHRDAHGGPAVREELRDMLAEGFAQELRGEVVVVIPAILHGQAVHQRGESVRAFILQHRRKRIAVFQGDPVLRLDLPQAQPVVAAVLPLHEGEAAVQETRADIPGLAQETVRKVLHVVDVFE